MSVSGRASRALWAAAAVALGACSMPPRVAQTAFDPSAPVTPDSELRDAGDVQNGGRAAAPPIPAGSDPSEPAAEGCPTSLNERLTIRQLDLGRDVRYKSSGYQGFPLDERVGFAYASDGSAYVAWMDDAADSVRVTPLGKDFRRRAADIEVRGSDVGGLVARDDGFALLTLRDDPGEQIVNRMGNFGRAVFFVRFRGGQEQFAVPLTGTRSITRKVDTAARDFAPGYLYGRLAWNGAKYGAYFNIFTAQGDPHGATDTPSDKLVYVDDSGGLLRGGWSWKCASSQGLRLWPEPDVYTPVCMATSAPALGVNLVIEDQPPVLLASEAAAKGWSGGQWGSIVKLADNSYFIGWLSREVGAANPAMPVRRTNDVAMIRLNSERQVLGKKRWLLETGSYGETNLHFARYGNARVLMVWDRMDNLSCGETDQICFGRYAGTFARVMDAEGNALTVDTQISAVPNSYDDLTTLPDGDVAWAYVPDEARDYSGQLPIDQNGGLRLPAKRRIAVARLRYCE